MKHAWCMAILLMGCEGTESTGSTGGDTISAGGSGGSSTSTPSEPMETVHVTDSYGDPLAGVPVVVNDAAGSVVQVDHTAADGSVSVNVPPEGSVSVFQSDTVWLLLSTVVSPPDGSTIRFPIQAPQKRAAGDTETTTYEVTFTDIPMEAFYVWVKLDGECDSDGAWPDQPSTKLTDRYCAGSPAHRLIAVAISEQQQILGWGETTAGTNPAGTVNATLSLNQTTISSTNIEISGIPGGTTSVSMWSLAADGWNLGQSEHQKAPLSWKPSAAVTVPDVPALDRTLGASVTVAGELARSIVYRRERFSAATQPVSWQFEADAIAWVLAGPATTSSPEQPEFSWSTAEPEDADYVQLGSGWTWGIGGVSYSVVLPADHVTSWRVPDVPDELSSFRPHASSTMGTVGVNYWDWGNVDGYADVLDGLPEDSGETLTRRSAQTSSPP